MSFTINLDNKVAIVTGSSRGLGRAMAVALAGAGADVIITSREKKSLVKTREEIEEIGNKVYCLELDVCEHQSIKSMVNKTIESFGHIDILVNNAGVNIRKPALEITWEEWDTILDTNLKGSFFCAQEVAPYMIDQKWGRIINIGSAACIFGYPSINPY